MRIQTLSAWSVVAAVVALALAGAAGADPVSSDPMSTVTITASSDCGTGQYTFQVPDGLGMNGFEQYDLTVPVTIYGANGATLAVINQLSVGVDHDPDVWLHFSVQNPNATTTSFTTTSSLVTFAALTNPQALATAGITLTDTNGDGALLKGLFPTGKAYKAMFDNTPVQIFGYLCDNGAAAAYSTAVWNDRKPGAGWSSITGSVYNIQAEFAFTLSAFDEASGTSDFKVMAAVPEPATMTLMGSGLLASVGIWWRRRMS